MKRATAFAFCVALSARLSEATDDLPRFEVASVKPSDMQDTKRRHVMDWARDVSSTSVMLPLSGNRVEAKGFTLKQLIAAAFRVPQRQLDGPDWLTDNRYDVEAVIPPDAPKNQANEMLQTLLQERFGLVTHRGTRAQTGYILSVAKDGPNLKVASSVPKEPPTAESLAQRARKPGPAGSSHYTFPRMDMQALADALAGMLHAPVEDRTGLKDKYTVVIDVAPPIDANDRDPEPRILNAVRKLGLTVKSGKVTSPVLIVDSIQKAPAPN